MGDLFSTLFTRTTLRQRGSCCDLVSLYASVTSRCSVETAGRIDLVFIIEASFDQS